MVSRVYKDCNGVCLLLPVRSSIYTTEQAVNPFRGGVYRPGDNRPQRSTAIPKCLPAIPVPTVRSKTMPTLPANSIRQDPCQAEKIFCWGQLSPPLSLSVRGQEVKKANHYAELAMPLMEIDSRTIIYNHYNRLDTMYSPVYSKHRRTLSKWT